MILRKPYAFLIKYFRLINLALAVLAIFIAVRAYNIVNFFNDYIHNNYSGNYYEGFYTSYINLFDYLAIIIIILGILGIYLLFRYKKKPTKAYIVSGLYYVIFFIFLMVIKNIMISIETTAITAESSRLYRDLSLIAFVPHIVLIVIFLFRGFGFNIRKFNFEADLKEMEINASDDEEIEITLNKDNIKLKRNLNRLVREFGYYFKENKVFFTVICFVLIGVFMYLAIGLFPDFVDERHNQGDSFVINDFKYTVMDSIVTNLDYGGNVIKEDKYYIVIKLNVENMSKESKSVDYKDFRLEINNDYEYPILDKGLYFIDYAEDYYSGKIARESSKIYSLIYEIEEEDLKKNYQIKVTSGHGVSNDELIGKYNYVNISPPVISKIENIKTVNMGEKLNFSGSNVGNTSITLSNAVIGSKYVYDYEYCANNVCNNYKDIVSVDYTKNDITLLVLDYEFELDNSVPFYKSNADVNLFINTFLKIKYTIDGQEYYSKITNVTPKIMKNKVALEVTKKVNNSDALELAFIIRNKEYTIKIK